MAGAHTAGAEREGEEYRCGRLCDFKQERKSRKQLTDQSLGGRLGNKFSKTGVLWKI
jgi:hypothetical protein